MLIPETTFRDMTVDIKYGDALHEAYDKCMLETIQLDSKIVKAESNHLYWFYGGVAIGFTPLFVLLLLRR